MWGWLRSSRWPTAVHNAALCTSPTNLFWMRLGPSHLSLQSSHTMTWAHKARNVNITCMYSATAGNFKLSTYLCTPRHAGELQAGGTSASGMAGALTFQAVALAAVAGAMLMGLPPKGTWHVCVGHVQPLHLCSSVYKSVHTAAVLEPGCRQPGRRCVAFCSCVLDAAQSSGLSHCVWWCMSVCVGADVACL
jgi:hypothetical protein